VAQQAFRLGCGGALVGTSVEAHFLAVNVAEVPNVDVGAAKTFGLVAKKIATKFDRVVQLDVCHHPILNIEDIVWIDDGLRGLNCHRLRVSQPDKIYG